MILMSLSFPVNTSWITQEANRSFKKRKETRHLVLHETVSKATARQELAYFNGGARDANAHGFLDWNEMVITLPLDEMGWHVGQPANSFTEGYELCHASNADDFAKQWSMAVEWFASRCHVYGRGADMIRSHHEIAKQYGGTDHTDPDDYFAAYGKTVDDFRADVARRLAGEGDRAPGAGTGQTLGAPKQPALNVEAAKEAIEELSRLTKVANSTAMAAYNFAANCARRGAGIPVTQDLGVPTRETAQHLVAILHELWHLTDQPDLRGVYATMADELRVATGLEG
jgi:hypothetical protein